MNGMTPDMIQALMMSGQNSPEMQQAQRQQAMAQMMRRQAMSPQPGAERMGRVVVPNIAGAVGQLGNAYAARQMQPRADEAERVAMAKNADTRSKFADALYMGMRRQYPQQQGVTLPPDGYEDR